MFFHGEKFWLHLINHINQFLSNTISRGIFLMNFEKQSLCRFKTKQTKQISLYKFELFHDNLDA